MEFCNKGMVWVDPPPPVMVKDHKFTFFLDPSLREAIMEEKQLICGHCPYRGGDPPPPPMTLWTPEVYFFS